MADFTFKWSKVPVASLGESGHGNIYLIPFQSPQSLGTKHLTKIGCGSSGRITRVIRDAQKVGVDLDGDSVFVCNVPDAFSAEKLLHERFYRRRISQVNTLGFNGATELFDVSIKTIKQVKSLNHQERKPFTQSARSEHRNLKGQYIRDGMLLCALHEKLSPSSFETGDIRLCLHKVGYYEPSNPNSLHAIKIDWFTFAGQLPLELWGNPVKDSPEWRRSIDELGQLQSQMTAFLNQWNLTNEGYIEAIERMNADGFLSLIELVKMFPSRAVRVEDGEWQHPQLLTAIAHPKTESAQH